MNILILLSSLQRETVFTLECGVSRLAPPLTFASKRDAAQKTQNTILKSTLTERRKVISLGLYVKCM